MKQIKFRGKRIDNGEWVYGSYVEINFHNSIDYVERYLIILQNGHEFEVEKETVGIFTGLHDENGKEIYEGDILKAFSQGKEYIGKVYYDEAQWFGAREYLYYAVKNSNVEIIGNVWESPELLNSNE